jgi:hypothetical protein
LSASPAVDGFDFTQHLGILADQVTETAQHLAALGGIHFRPGPRFQRAAGGRYRAAHLGFARDRGGCPDFTRSRIHRLQLSAVPCIAPFAIDIHLVVFH